MRKLTRSATILAAVLFIFSCKSQPQPVALEPDAGGPRGNDEQIDTLEEVYDRYEDRLILDGATTYTVKRGDQLSAITIAHWGYENGFFFPIIMMASNDVVADPDLIKPGMQLTVPDLQKNLTDPHARGMIKEFLIAIAGVYQIKEKNDIRDALTNLANSL
jgi:nucleoid-associated protein YgaU